MGDRGGPDEPPAGDDGAIDSHSHDTTRRQSPAGPTSGRDNTARHKARKRALDILFESEAQGLALGATLSTWVTRADPPVRDYTRALVEGVAAEQERVDQLIASHARGWTLERMPAVDRNVLRIGLYEVLYAAAVPDAVAVDEAVELARELSTDESPGFVNGVLGSALREKPQLPA